MNMTSNSAATLYKNLMLRLRENDMRLLCNNSYISHELLNVNITLTRQFNNIKIFSHPQSRAFPITFALAELSWILSGTSSIHNLSRFNKSIINFSENGIVTGAYGNRFMLNNQIYKCIDKLNEDINTRQACIVIYQNDDIDKKHIPCNVFIQFMIRDNKLNMFITSRSSDFITGFPIDIFHWQFIHILIKNSLSHPNITLGDLYYNIASLHVYEKDKCFMLYDLNSLTHGNEHVINFINYDYTFKQLQHKVTENFAKCNCIEDLLEYIFIFDIKIKEKFIKLRNIFKNQDKKYKPKR